MPEDDFRFWQIVLKKSFLTDGRFFLGPLVRCSCGRGHRSNETLLRQDERNKLIIEIARRFYPGLSHRETAHRLRSRLLIYRNGRWRRTCSLLKSPHDPESLDAALWKLLRIK
jgi:hypothetical protein